jgi:hypothetical protein
MEILERGSLFSMFRSIGFCVGLKIWWSEIVLLVMKSELTVQYVIAIYRQGSSTIVVHLVGPAYRGKDIVFRIHIRV